MRRLLPTSSLWRVLLIVWLLVACATYFWIGYAKPICALPVTPNGFINRLKSHSGTSLTADEILAQYRGDVSSPWYSASVAGTGDHLIVTITPKSYSMGWGVHTRRYRYQFDTLTRRTRVYQESGECFFVLR